MLDLLLQIGPAHTDPALAAEEEKSLALLHDLWRGHLPSTPICCVVARLLTQQLLQSGQLGSAQQDLLLSLAKHGEGTHSHMHARTHVCVCEVCVCVR